ncbi:YfiT family bacillithiol transferase [Maribacter luteus]|uniref:YfiT family bacillithiol transferase n=1 Tax=Maribacter luteus TaxID=2594478 RepID=UPI0024904F74|nr:putative metal-dependent hydrolase [Maribacter luteus]
MDKIVMEALKYPIGHFEYSAKVSKAIVDGWIKDLEELPLILERLVGDLTMEQLETPYRPDGWTIRQLVHHIADSHHHSYTRFKWALTENGPLIKAYDEKSWSSLSDAKTATVELSLNYLKALHAKLVFLLKSLDDQDLQKYYVHPDDKSKITVKENIGKYAWHGRHHCAHIQGLLERKGW